MEAKHNFCPACGAQLTGTGAFCPVCGAKQDATAQSVPVVPVVPVPAPIPVPQPVPVPVVAPETAIKPSKPRVSKPALALTIVSMVVTFLGGLLWSIPFIARIFGDASFYYGDPRAFHFSEIASVLCAWIIPIMVMIATTTRKKGFAVVCLLLAGSALVMQGTLSYLNYRDPAVIFNSEPLRWLNQYMNGTNLIGQFRAISLRFIHWSTPFLAFSSLFFVLKNLLTSIAALLVVLKKK